MIGNKICNFITLKRPPSQNQDYFQVFIDNIEINLENLTQNYPFYNGSRFDLNAKSKNHCRQGSTRFRGLTIDILTSGFGVSQIINEGTPIFESFSSCIDLIFTTQSNLVVESSVHPSLHANCHHQVVFADFNLQIYYPLLYPPETSINKQILNL